MKRKILFCIIFCLSANLAWAGGDNVFNNKITDKFVNIELQQVLRSLSEKTGLSIVYDEQISHKKVSGSFKQAVLTDVVNRLLSGTNHSLEMDDKSKTLFIKSFGKVKYVSTGGGTHGVAGPLSESDMSYGELRALLARQAEDFNRQLADGSEFLDEFGMTRSEEQAQLERQQEQFENENRDPDHFVTEMNKTNGELRKLQKAQQEEYDRYLQNDEAMAEDGLTIGEHREKLAAQSARYQKELQDNEESIPGLGMARGAHRQLLVKQMKKFKQSLTE